MSIRDINGNLYMGFIFHSGLYSFFAYDDMKSVDKRTIQNGSEWYLSKLNNDRGEKINPTRLYHQNFGINFDYFRAKFHISRESICDWLDICVKCKATFAVITAKHHDSYCLWNTNTTDKKSRNDIVQIFKEECIKRNLQFCIYYSWMEFESPMTIDYFTNTCIPQITELLQYGPSSFWFDGDWVIKTKTIITYINQIVSLIISMGISVNDRITSDNQYLSTYKVGPNRYFPKEYTQNWQHIDTIGISWGYNKFQKEEHYKNGKQLLDMYNKTTSLGGVLLLNIGPKHDGTLDENELNSLNEFIDLL